MKTIGITRMPTNYIGDTDKDVLFSEEILNSIPDVAKHWDEYNDKNLWDKSRFKNKSVYFIDHETVEEAYSDLRFNEIVGFDMVSSAFEADVRRKSAYDILEQNGLKADEEWKKKIETRYEQKIFEMNYGLPFHERHPFRCRFNNETGKYENGKVEIDDLPF